MYKRYVHLALTIAMGMGFSSATVNGESSSARTPEIRALAIGLQDDLKQLEILDASMQSVGQLSLRPFAFSKGFTCPIVGGQLLFGVSAGTDKDGNPLFEQIATYDWENGDEQVCLLFLPRSLVEAEAQSSQKYTIERIDMSTKSFESGHSKIINLTPLDTLVRAGEHEIAVEPWDRAEISKIEELTGIKMAQITISYFKEDTEQVAYQSRVRYTESARTLILIYTDSRNGRTTTRIISDSGRLFR